MKTEIQFPSPTGVTYDELYTAKEREEKKNEIVSVPNRGYL